MTIPSNLELLPGWQGHLQLTYRHTQGKTQAIQHQGTAPLKVQRSFYPEATAICHNTILHTAGGVVGGDRLRIDIDLQPRSRAVITTAAAGKIYGSNGRIAVQNIIQNISDNACLEWLPQETIVFNGALFEQSLRVNLAATGTWLGWEIVRFGRTAHGERFTSGLWQSATEVYRAGKPIWIDRQRLSPVGFPDHGRETRQRLSPVGFPEAKSGSLRSGSPTVEERQDRETRQRLDGDEQIDSPHSLAGQPIVGSLAWIGAEVSKELAIEARSLFVGDPRKIGVTRLTEGLLCRYRGDSTTEVRQWFTAVWHLLRYSFLQSPPINLRVWQ